MAFYLVRPAARFGQRVATGGLLLVLLEVARRSVEAVRDRWRGRPHRGGRDLAALSIYSNRALLAFAVTFPFGTHVLDALGSTSGIIGALRSFGVAFLFYLPLRSRLVLAPFFTDLVRDRLFHNIGPGLAHAIGSATRKTLTAEDFAADIPNYMSKQEIGPYGLSQGTQSNFLTSKLVLLLPRDLKHHVCQFKALSKKYQRRFPGETSSFYPTDSQGLCHYEQMLYKLNLCGTDPTVRPAPKLELEYTSAGQSRYSVSSIISWDEKPDTRWYFRCFDVKPLMDIVDFHEEYKNFDINECYITFLKSLKHYLDSYEECKNNYYFVFYEGKLSSSMPDFVRMIQAREGSVGFKDQQFPLTEI